MIRYYKPPEPAQNDRKHAYRSDHQETSITQLIHWRFHFFGFRFSYLSGTVWFTLYGTSRSIRILKQVKLFYILFFFICFPLKDNIYTHCGSNVIYFPSDV